MNKIRVVRNVIIPFDCEGVKIENNSITFLNSGNYSIDYIDSDNIDLNIVLEKNICVSLFEFSNNNSIIFSNKYTVSKGSSLIINKFTANENTDEKMDIILNGDNSNVKYNFSSISSGNDKYVINIYHNKKNTCSDVYNRTIAKEGSSNMFDINGFVENGITNCSLNQQTKIVTLGNSNNRINPNMFIEENSTTAIHSSTIGNVSDDDLFYMMSRGIDYNTCVSLIVKGMILSNINADIENRERILKILDFSIGGE